MKRRNKDHDWRIVDIQLAMPGNVRLGGDIERERQVAVADLLEHNFFEILNPLPDGCRGPFCLSLDIEEDRLIFELADENGRPLDRYRLSVKPFRRLVKEYFLICDSYYQALGRKSAAQIEAIDMGRRGVHNEGSELLKERLAAWVHMDMDTARRLFTLLCVLHIRSTM